MQIRRPPRISTVEVVGLVTALAKAPSLNGASSTIATKGADRARKSHRDVMETTFTPAIFKSAQAITTASATHQARFPCWNQGNMRLRYATNNVDRSPYRRSRQPERAR